MNNREARYYWSGKAEAYEAVSCVLYTLIQGAERKGHTDVVTVLTNLLEGTEENIAHYTALVNNFESENVG